MFVILFLLIFDFSYLTYLHYAKNHSTVCSIKSSFNCDIVNKSSYSEFLGIPVATLGILSSLILIFLVYKILKRKDTRFRGYALYLSLINILFSSYLIRIELFVLKTFCIFCLAADFLIFIFSIFVISLNKENKLLYKISIIISGIFIILIIYTIFRAIQ